MDDHSLTSPGLLDKIAVTLSSVCLLHCLTLPLLIVVLPFLAQIDEDHFHVQMIFVILPVSIIAFTLGYCRHCNKCVITWGVIGMLLLVIGGTIAHSAYGIIVDRVLTICGTLIIAAAHYFNNRLSRHSALGSVKRKTD